MSARACLGVCVPGMCSCRTRACAGTLASALSRANGRVRTQALSEAEARPRLDEKVAKDIHLSVSVLRQRQAAHAQVLGSPCLRRFPGTLALLLAKMRWVIDVRCIPAGRRQQRGVRVLQKGPTKTSVAWQFLRVQKLEREREQKRGQGEGEDAWDKTKEVARPGHCHVQNVAAGAPPAAETSTQAMGPGLGGGPGVRDAASHQRHHLMLGTGVRVPVDDGTSIRVQAFAWARACVCM